DAATRRVVVRSEIPNPNGELRAEMFASFKIATGEGSSALAVPADAVIREGDLAAVWVEEAPMVFRRRKVKIGLVQAVNIQIREGLNAGELVVARGAIFVDNEWRTQRSSERGRPMLRSLIAFCLARRPLVLVSFLAFIGLGYAAFTTLNIEAYPDPAPPIIELIA